MEQQRLNAEKCFEVLKALHEIDEENEENLSVAALKQKLSKLDEIASDDIIREVCKKVKTSFNEAKLHLALSNGDLISLYTTYLQMIILTIIETIDFESSDPKELRSESEINLCIKVVKELSEITLQKNLHTSLYDTPKHTNKQVFFGFNAADSYSPEKRFTRLELAIEVFARIMVINRLVPLIIQDEVVRCYMAGIYSLFLAYHNNEYELSEGQRKNLQEKLDFIWHRVSKVQYFRNIFIFKSYPVQCAPYMNELGQELFKRIKSKQGFESLVRTLCTTPQTLGNHITDKDIYNTIANIFTFPGGSRIFHHNAICQIFDFLTTCIVEKTLVEHMGAALLTLRRLYDLNETNRNYISLKLTALVGMLTGPIKITDRKIIMDNSDFSQCIEKLFNLFCTSTVECLPSVELIKFLPLLLQLYEQLHGGNLQKHQICRLVARCLNNCSKQDLGRIITSIYQRQLDTQWLRLHQRLIVISTCDQIYVEVGQADEVTTELKIYPTLPDLLIAADHNQLTYEIFMILLNLMSAILEPDGTTCSNPNAADLLQTEEEFMGFLGAKYPGIIDVMLTLTKLVTYKPLIIQVFEHVKECLEFLCNFLQKRCTANILPANRDSADQMLLIVLALIHEIISNSEMAADKSSDLLHMLNILKEQDTNTYIQERVLSLLNLLDAGSSSNYKHKDEIPFLSARSMLERKEVHLQVYGLQTLIDLMKHKDPVSCANGHVIMALALTALKAEDSYVFLNCVRLFVVLLDVMEAQVLEMLCDEYLNEENETNFRLVVGETLVKISQELGPLCYKYKDVLLNCFMYGARSLKDEFRMSALANLGQLCKTLTYQIHSYMQELLQLIHHELVVNTYLPTKRGAILILHDLIRGMDTICDHAESLKPIYKILQGVGDNSTFDGVTRRHAMNAIALLDEKTLEFFEKSPEVKIQIPGTFNVAMESIKKCKITELD